MIVFLPYGSFRPLGRFCRGLAIANLLVAVALVLTVLALPVMVWVSSLC